MRQRLITEQRWNTRTREIRVPPAKQPRLEGSPPASPSMPELESTDSEPEGIYTFMFYRWQHGMVRQASLYSYRVVGCQKDTLKNEKYY